MEEKKIENVSFKSERGSFDLNVYFSPEKDELTIKINNFEYSYTYGQLIDCDEIFKNYDKMQDIYTFIHSLICGNKIEIKSDKTLILKYEGKDIRIHPKSYQPSVSLKHMNELFKEYDKRHNINHTQNHHYPGWKLVKPIEDHHYANINSICLLKDGRVVSGGAHADGQDGRIVVYNQYTYESDITILENSKIYTVCGLKEGDLASGDDSGKIKIWEIKEFEYRHKKTLEGHIEMIDKVIELKDGRLCSCSEDKTIRIWNNKKDDKCKILAGHTKSVRSVIETQDYIVSAGSEMTVRIWDKSTGNCAKEIERIYCCKNNGLGCLEKNKVILGGENELFLLDAPDFRARNFKHQLLEKVYSICVLGKNQVLIGNSEGSIIYFNTDKFDMVFHQKLDHKNILSLIETKDGLVASSYGIIDVYE